ncbi:MAG TPA: hypothetical protein VMY37_02505 [Thermoguttaceae bacterium]|nr:hypothetical protein [Thermoguttaceae bacterium]
MKPIEELVAAWDFQGASAALAKVQFEEKGLAARLTAWRSGVDRLVDLKARIVKKINEADPRLKKSDLMIRGAGGEIVEADEQGIEAKLSTGKTESLAWPDVGPQAIEKLIGLVSAPDTPDDRLAAGVLSLASKDPTSAERHFEQARILGAEIGPYLAPLGATAFAKAQDLVKAKKFSETESLLANIEAKYADTPWFAFNKPALDALRIQVRAGKAAVLQAEADKLYVEAARLFEERQFFDLKPVLEELKADYSKTRPVTDSDREPSFAEMEEAVASLGEFLTVRLDGKGDFTSIQAAVSAARVNSLVEIQDSGLYNESIDIPQHRAGLTIRGGKGCWPVIGSLGPIKDLPILVAVHAPRITLERLVLAHVRPGGVAGGSPLWFHTLSVYAGPLRVRSAILFGKVRDSRALWTDSGTECHLQGCLVLNYTHSSGRVLFTNSLLLGDQVDPHGPFDIRSCTVLSQCGNCPAVLIDSIIANVGARPERARIENCDVLGGIPSGVGKACFSADPQFRDPANLDYRLLPTSPCIGKASDGGDIGCRYTPEMNEMIQKALELRAKGIIKF